jgi:hypothetical protein
MAEHFPCEAGCDVNFGYEQPAYVHLSAPADKVCVFECPTLYMCTLTRTQTCILILKRAQVCVDIDFSHRTMHVLSRIRELRVALLASRKMSDYKQRRTINLRGTAPIHC